MARILALTSRVPWPPREGHQLRTFHLLRALASKHQVHLLSCLRPDDTPDETGPLREMLAGFESFPLPSTRSRPKLIHAAIGSLLSSTPFVARKYEIPALRTRLAELVRHFDLVHVDMLPLMAYADQVPASTRLVLNAHNVEQTLLERRIEVESSAFARWFLRTQLPRLRAFERGACERADAVLACSRADAEQLLGLAPGTPVHVVPNGVDLEFNRPGANEPDASHLVFVGQMSWFPNRDGMEWLLSEVLPRVLSARPDVRLTVVGKSDGLKVPPSMAANVRLAGFVDDVRPYIQAAGVYIVPLRTGSGTRLKILEAMALGKAIVTTRAGAEGISLGPGVDALFADEAGAFAETILKLISNPAEIRRLGCNARSIAEREYGWDAIGAALLSHYEALIESRGEDRGAASATMPSS
jgi:glycosyltransferase involved in cell wall biosynthesis